MSAAATEAGGGDPGRRDGGEPFVETRAGGLFFLNAVLAGPALLVLWPTALRAALGALGVLRGPSGLLDPIPDFARQVGPYVAWASVLPLWGALRNLRLPVPPAARWALRAFVALHAGVLAWWAARVLG